MLGFMVFISIIFYLAAMTLPTAILVGIIKVFDRRNEGSFVNTWFFLCASFAIYFFFALWFFDSVLEYRGDAWPIVTWLGLGTLFSGVFGYYFRHIQQGFISADPNVKPKESYIEPRIKEDTCLSYFDLS